MKQAVLLCRSVARFNRSKPIQSFMKYSTGKNNDAGCCQISEVLEKEIITMGQPTYWSHPHLFDLTGGGNEEVTPGLTKKEYESRRDKYVTFLTNYQKYYYNGQGKSKNEAANIQDASYCDNSFIAVIPSCMTSFMAPDVPYTFKQNSDFFYLTGFKEPNSVIVLSRTTKDKNSYKAALFVREKDRRKEVWEGAFTGPENINKICGIEHAYGLGEFQSYVKNLLKDNENKKMALWRYPTEAVMKEESGPNCFNPEIEQVLDELSEEGKNDKLVVMNDLDGNSVLHTSRYYVQLCRVKKSQAEIDIMRKSCEIASAAFVKTMLASHAGVDESLLYAKFDYETRIRGAEYLAYIPVIAGGPRATILHYIRNNQVIANHRMLLMDAGCQYRDYASDITRTWPINGQFTGPQRDVYEACLNVQQYCLDKVKKGVTINKLYGSMIYKIAGELVRLGILSATQVDLSTTDRINAMTQKRISQYCPHDIGHYLGLDVHDSPEISKSLELEAGTVITIEPGKRA